MATLIICPACDTRYETAAVFPPEGRKVRCSKCGHVWQAKAVAQPEPAASGITVASKAPPPPKPLPSPAAKPKPKPKPATVNTGMGGFAGIGTAAKPAPSLAGKMASAGVAEAQADADFTADEDLAAQVERMNAEAAMAAEGVLPDEKPSSGGIFARLRAKKPPAPAPAKPPELPEEEAPPVMPPSEPEFSGIPPEEAELAALAAGEIPPAEAPSRVVAMGWLALILFVALIAGLLVFAKDTVLSVLPGAQRLYGGGSGASGLTFEGVRYGWANDGGQTVLEIQGDVVNSSSSPVAVPQVVIALRDDKGNEISEWTTDTGADELAPGEHAAFLRQIPSPPSNVRSVKVRLAKAN
jgi:predicted Zn finger-like uncharacterized protein